MPLHINQSGVWKEPTPYVNDGGVWKQPDSIWVNDAGVWKETYTAFFGYTVTLDPCEYVSTTHPLSVAHGGTAEFTLSMSTGMSIENLSHGTFTTAYKTVYITIENVTSDLTVTYDYYMP